jgi:hypothetical protein
MSCGVCADTPAPLPVTRIKQRPAPPEDIFLGLVQILDPDVKVELLRAGGVRPPRRLMISHLLERQHHPTVQVERRPAVTQRPPRIRLIQRTAKKRLVEPGQFRYIGAIQHHTLQLGSHEGQRSAAARRASRAGSRHAVEKAHALSGGNVSSTSDSSVTLAPRS